jgi:hypothetical protein
MPVCQTLTESVPRVYGGAPADSVLDASSQSFVDGGNWNSRFIVGTVAGAMCRSTKLAGEPVYRVHHIVLPARNLAVVGQ